MTTMHEPVPQPGKRLLAGYVDYLAVSDPNRRFALIPKSDNVEDGFREVTIHDIARAVNAMSRWMEKHLGAPKQTETIAYMGNNDIRYIIFILAANKTGNKIFLPSTRLPDEVYAHIFQSTNCKTMLFSQERNPRVSELKGIFQGMNFWQVPSMADILDDEEGLNHYPLSKTYEESEDEVAFMIHSSGTTGMPKPVTLTHGFVGTLDYCAYLPLPPGHKPSFPGDLGPTDLVLWFTPYFHLMGLASFTESIFHNVPIVVCPDKPLSVDLLVKVIQKAKPTAALFPPSIVEDMSQSQGGLAAISTLKYLFFGGGPLSPEAGSKLSRYTELRSAIGSSEMGILCSMVPEGEGTWSYFQWNPNFGIDMQSVGEGLYELVIPRREDSRTIHGIFHTFPALHEFRSKDLFAPHPSNPQLWKYHGRLDDVIVLSNGEKLNPVTLEKIVEDNPAVNRALLVGQARFQSALLIEPVWEVYETDFDQNEQKVIDAIWPAVQAANRTVPDYGQVMRNMIRISSKDKPFKTTPKGSTQRHAVNRDYAPEIDAIFAAQDDQLDIKLPSIIDVKGLTTYVCEIICRLLDRPSIKTNEDLFSSGLDSLRTIQLSKLLRKAVTDHNPDLDAQSISLQALYTHPTVERLTELLWGTLTGESAVGRASRSDKISGLVSKYTQNLPRRSPSLSTQLPGTSTVILTGSTGSLGTYILHSLLNSKTVAKVYCFNRSDAAIRQKEGFEAKGLNASLLENPEKVEFLQVSFGDPRFGLPDDKYNELLDSVDMIIHNAWKVNFNHPIESFEDPHLKGVYEFVSFSINSRYNAHLAFISSVSTIGAWHPSKGPNIPELPMETPDVVLEQGYGESKHVAERICLEASRTAAVPTSVFRVGQIAGPDTRMGIWNPHEWIPTVVATSKAIGKVPLELGGWPVDWISVDTLATITLEILQTRRSSPAQERNSFFHLMNPYKGPWSSLIPAIQEMYPVQPVTLNEWVHDLESIQHPSEMEIREKPALKLLGFYQGLANNTETLSAPVSVKKAQQASQTMGRLGPVSHAQMLNWLQQWNF